MPKNVAHLAGRSLGAYLAITTLLLTGGCESLRHPKTPAAEETRDHSADRQDGDLGDYLDLLKRLAASDPETQAILLDELYAAVRDTGSAPAMLKYALALGSPGYVNSNPAEASDLLARTETRYPGLNDDERAFAAAFQRDYESRAQLEQSLARKAQELEQQQASSDAATRQELQALTAENARLNKERDELQQKLDAIAEIERSLMEREPETPAAPGIP